MSKPRYYWYSNVQRTLRAYPKGLAEESQQNILARNARQEALTETANTPDGALKVKLIEILYFKNTYTIEGAARILHISFRTATRWNVKFIYKVAEKLGYRKSGISEP